MHRERQKEIAAQLFEELQVFAQHAVVTGYLIGRKNSPRQDRSIIKAIPIQLNDRTTWNFNTRRLPVIYPQPEKPADCTDTCRGPVGLAVF